MRKKSDTPSLKPQRSKDSSSFSSVFWCRPQQGHWAGRSPWLAFPEQSRSSKTIKSTNIHHILPSWFFSCIPHGFSLNLKAFGFLVLSSVLSCADESRHRPPKAPNGALITIEAAPRASGAGNELCGQQLLRPTAAFLKAKLKYVKSHRKMQIETYHIHHRKGVEIK